MKGMIFKKTVLLGGFFLLATLMSIQLSWSCDDDDKWDHDCHDKWHCHHYGKPCDPPKIQRVFLDYNPDPETFIRFSIWGKNFDNGASPVVTLGGEFDLTVGDRSDDYIVATLPKSEEQGFEFGDYRLVVSTGHDSACKYWKDRCSKCKDKYCRDSCSKWKDRYCKNKYCNDDKHKCKCKDRYSLTIANPQGQAGPPGISGYEKNEFRSQITFPLVGGNKVEVPCSSPNKKLLGGGGGITSFPSGSSPDHFYVIYNGPGPDPRSDGREAWVIKWKYYYEYETLADVVIYAICADALN